MIIFGIGFRLVVVALALVLERAGAWWRGLRGAALREDRG